MYSSNTPHTAESIRIAFFEIIFESYLKEKFDANDFEINKRTQILLNELFQEFITLKEYSENREIKTKKDLIAVFFKHYYLLFPQMPTSTGVLNEIDLMLHLQHEIILAETEKAELRNKNRKLEEEIRQLKKAAESKKNLLSYQEEFVN